MKDLRPISQASAVLAAFLTAFAVVGCGSDSGGGDGKALPQGSEQVSLEPADLTTNIDNPYWPMTPGSKWVYRETDEQGNEQRVEVTVTDKTKTLANGIEARVVHDVVSAGGEPVEVTDDWYAQDSAANIWYLGEDTAEYENGRVTSRSGSFEAGVDGAEAGIAMPADPRVGLAYRQEYLAGEAEDEAEVLSLDQRATVPFGSFDGLLQTKDTNPLNKPEPQVEHKFYAKGIGPVLVVGVSGGGREELVSYAKGSEGQGAS